MKMKKHAFIVTVFIVTICLSSCSKNDNNSTTAPALKADSVFNLQADPAISDNHFVFYSLERNAVVPLADSATASWDIAFRSTTVLINGGTSGPANGGAYIQTAAAFNDFSIIPSDSVFRLDASPAYAIATGSGNGWYNYDFSTNIISPIPGRLIITRTAAGKYAKLEILSYYKDAPVSPTPEDIGRYYTFRFVIQPDGSKFF